MLSERLFEDVLVKYPDLIEQGLKLIGRQVNYFGKRIDILFEDKFKEKLIIELKKDNLDRNALSQVMEYEGYILSEKDPSARVMLIANRIPLNLKKAMDHHGIEYKEITHKQIFEFLEKNDHQLFTQITSPLQQQSQQSPMKIFKILPNSSKITMAGKLDEILHAGGTWDELIAKAEIESKKLDGHIKYSKGVLDAHIRYRTITQKNSEYLRTLIITSTGIFPKNQISENLSSKIIGTATNLSRYSDNSTNYITSRRGKIIELINQGFSDFEILEAIDKIFPPGHFATSNKQAIYGTRRDLRL